MTTSRQEILTFIEDEFPEDEIPLFDGLDDALIGIGRGDDLKGKAIYDEAKILSILMERDGMDYEEAREFHDFNIAGTKFGDTEIIYVTRIPREKPAKQE